MQEHTGMTFNAYVNDLRLEFAAQRLIMADNATVEVVAKEAGFVTSRTFMMRFKDKFQLSPTEYRKQYQVISE